MEYNVRAVERALSILKCFNSNRKEISLLEISEIMSLNKSTVYRLLVNLKNAGFVDTTIDGKYIIGNEIVRLANIRQNDDFLIKGSYSIMESLAQLSGETIILVKYDNCRVICLDKIESTNALKITSEIGVNLPMMKGATGKSIAAFLTDAELEKCVNFQQREFKEQYYLPKLKNDFKQIRKNGYALTTSEIDDGVTAFAVPILGHDGHVLGSISIAGPDFRFNEKIINSFKHKAIEEIGNLSKKMGYSLNSFNPPSYN
ncbi:MULTISPECIES: IclR family transcriptional regulator [unclassified Sedimentibacter]|uniref:IclR family transcriptional regulator n=1 Tax=unclassified Sedimentibacter TaxID=2649220 RepID=UPI0027DEBBAA|nr:IclR family transcriptional regulator [Sedimentibacter sp. MB35-C1]WMJ78638.1 IclR family transcriptional regulator [Sedimentibacter sp. MB35-C1]